MTYGIRNFRCWCCFLLVAFSGVVSVMGATTTVETYITMGPNGGVAVNVYDEAWESGVLVGSTTYSAVRPPLTNFLLNTSYNAPIGRVKKMRIYDPARSPTDYYLSPVDGITFAAGSPFVASFSGSGVFQTATLCVTNKDSLFHYFALFHDGVMQNAAVLLGPGDFTCYTVTTGNLSGWVVNRLDLLFNSDGQLTQSNAVPVGALAFGTNGVSDAALAKNQYSPATNAAEGSIKWTNSISASNTNVAKDASLQTGFSALFDAGSKANGLLQQIETDVNGSKLNVSTNFGALSARIDTNFMMLSGDLRGLGSNVNAWSTLTNAQAYQSNNFPTNGQAGLGLAASNSAAAGLLGSTNGLVSGLAANATFATPAGFWTLTAAIGGRSYTIDIDPMHNSGVADFAGRCRGLVGYLIRFLFILAVVKRSFAVMEKLGTAQQARSAGTSVAGTNLNSGVALGMAVLITVVIAAVPAFFVHWMFEQGVISFFGVNPLAAFVSGSNSVTAAVSLVDAFIPLGSILFYVVSYFGYSIIIQALFQGVLAAVRMLVG